MSGAPKYVSEPALGAATLTTGDASRTAPTTVATLITAAAAGTRIDAVDFVALATTTATGVRLFLYDGTTYRLLLERPVLAITAAAGTVWDAHFTTNNTPDIFPIVLKTGWSLRATVNDTQTGIGVIARGGDF